MRSSLGKTTTPLGEEEYLVGEELGDELGDA
jgi:hypothetical protein